MAYLLDFVGGRPRTEGRLEVIRGEGAAPSGFVPIVGAKPWCLVSAG